MLLTFFLIQKTCHKKSQRHNQTLLFLVQISLTFVTYTQSHLGDMATDAAGGWGHTTKTSFCCSLLLVFLTCCLLLSGPLLQWGSSMGCNPSGKALLLHAGMAHILLPYRMSCSPCYWNPLFYVVYNTVSYFQLLNSQCNPITSFFWEKRKGKQQTSSLFCYGTLMLWKHN